MTEAQRWWRWCTFALCPFGPDATGGAMAQWSTWSSQDSARSTRGSRKMPSVSFGKKVPCLGLCSSTSAVTGRTFAYGGRQGHMTSSLSPTGNHWASPEGNWVSKSMRNFAPLSCHTANEAFDEHSKLFGFTAAAIPTTWNCKEASLNTMKLTSR